MQTSGIAYRFMYGRVSDHRGAADPGSKTYTYTMEGVERRSVRSGEVVTREDARDLRFFQDLYQALAASSFASGWRQLVPPVVLYQEIVPKPEDSAEASSLTRRVR